MKQVIFAAALLFTSCTGSPGNDVPPPPKEETVSRFIAKDDPKVESLAGIDLPKSWWSRPYEYAWALEFVEKNDVVLDAACGISHPFKWHLNQISKETWACDTDSRIQNITQIINNTRQDLGDAAFQTLIHKPELYKSAHLVKASIDNLPDSMPQFDKIFCISALEHMPEEARKSTLAEFARKLSPEGLIVLTVDYPVVSLETLFADAKSAGLEPAGPIEVGPPSEDAIAFLPDGITSHIQLSVYRCLLKHSDAKQ